MDSSLHQSDENVVNMVPWNDVHRRRFSPLQRPHFFYSNRATWTSLSKRTCLFHRRVGNLQWHPSLLQQNEKNGCNKHSDFIGHSVSCQHIPRAIRDTATCTRRYASPSPEKAAISIYLVVFGMLALTTRKHLQQKRPRQPPFLSYCGIFPQPLIVWNKIHRFISHTDVDSEPLNPTLGHKKGPA